jgi:two-component system, NtrC family, sensor kinase
MFNNLRIKLKTKIWVTVLSIVLLFSFFLLLYFPTQQGRYMLRNYNNEVQNLANTVAVGVEISISEQNFKGIKDQIEIVRNDPRLAYVQLLEQDTIWNEAHDKFNIRDSVLKTYPETAITTGLLLPGDSLVVKEASLNTRLMNGNGVILLAFKTREIVEIKNNLRKISLIVSGIVLLIAIGIGLWLARHISIPVLALRDAANRVGQGDLSQRIKNISRDEIGDLGKAFNKMVDDLARTQEELRYTNSRMATTNETLEKTIEDLKEAQEQLIQAEKMASLGQLTAGIAHEINNPINFVSANIQPLKDDMVDIIKVINQYEEIIKDKNLESIFASVQLFRKEANIDISLKEINDLLNGMDDGAKRTSEIVKGLRNFSRMDQNVLKKSNLNESLDATLALLHSSYKNRIEIVKNYGDIPEVDCFPGQINQVFMNIISNAIQAIPQEGEIVIKTWLEGDMVKISLKDSGAGMTEAVRKKIFDPFFTTKEVGKGTGLGLSISYGIIEKHNGEIEVFSKPGHGTEFIISIPIEQPITN